MKSTRKSAGKMTKVVFRRYPDGQVIALFRTYRGADGGVK